MGVHLQDGVNLTENKMKKASHSVFAAVIGRGEQCRLFHKIPDSTLKEFYAKPSYLKAASILRSPNISPDVGVDVINTTLKYKLSVFDKMNLQALGLGIIKRAKIPSLALAETRGKIESELVETFNKLSREEKKRMSKYLWSQLVRVLADDYLELTLGMVYNNPSTIFDRYAYNSILNGCANHGDSLNAVKLLESNQSLMKNIVDVFVKPLLEKEK